MTPRTRSTSHRVIPASALLSTKQLADLLGVSVQYLEKGRQNGYGPRFMRLGGRGGGKGAVRYHALDVALWLDASTSPPGEPNDSHIVPSDGERATPHRATR